MTKLCLCLSHELVEKDKLSRDFVLRLDKTFKVYENNKCDYIVLTGGSHHLLSTGHVSNFACNYLRNNYDIKYEKFIFIKEAKDTIGEAIFCKLEIDKIDCKNIFIVTSDWHLKRAKSTFNLIYNDKYQFKWFEIFGDKKYFIKEKDNSSLEELKSWYNKKYNNNNDLLIKNLKRNHKYYS